MGPFKPAVIRAKGYRTRPEQMGGMGGKRTFRVGRLLSLRQAVRSASIASTWRNLSGLRTM
jgi:hypothetical protein